ncbi:pantetheine-phosphate adenylyltransferase [SAR202 cluster bacterium AC-409-J13_OGT_754m]|nr:pantetheine-phosphate adenylyltransferase [SAR202 cluster bacterium AC-409-J13_OGT_754m]
MTICLYPGTFDPVTLGHVDVATRASRIFEKVVIGVYENPKRNLLFETRERVDLFREVVNEIDNVEVTAFDGLMVDYAQRIGADVIVRGLRGGSDFEYEHEMAFMNKKLAPTVELVCLITSLEYQFVSSSLLKEVAGLGGDIGDLVPPQVAQAVCEKMGFTP